MTRRFLESVKTSQMWTRPIHLRRETEREEKENAKSQAKLKLSECQVKCKRT